MKRRADQLQIGDFVDLENDKFADAKGDNPSFEFEYIEVCDIEHETADCIEIGFVGCGVVGFPPGHLLTVMKRPPMRALFRTTTTKDFRGSVTAVLFDVEYGHGLLTIYAHFGQHGAGTREWIRADTRTATPAEYADLKAELEQIYGESIQVYKRIPRNAKGKA